jgi:hypothetical protein
MAKFRGIDECTWLPFSEYHLIDRLPPHDDHPDDAGFDAAGGLALYVCERMSTFDLHRLEWRADGHDTL